MATTKPWTLFRHPHLEEILSLDPQEDHQRIVFLSRAYELPFEYLMAEALSYIRTYADEYLSETLARGGEVFRAATKRADDTDILLTTIQEYGYDSPEGREALRKINAAHRGLDLRNDDHLYTLALGVMEPIYWSRKYGWRPLTRHEELAFFYNWCEMGKRLGIRDLPPDLESLERIRLEREAKHTVATENTRKLGAALDVRGYMESTYHPSVAWLLERCFLCFLGDAAIESLGMRRPNPLFRAAFLGLVRHTRWIRRLLPARKEPMLRANMPRAAYPCGFGLDEVGPDLEARRARFAAAAAEAGECPVRHER